MSENAAHSDPEVPGDLRAALDAWRPAGARPEFRELLRERVLASASATAEPATSEELDPEHVSGLESRLADNPVPPARPEFQGHLREKFLSAGQTLAGSPTGAEGSAEAAKRVQDPADRETPRVRRRPRPLVSLPLYVGLAVAAALVLFLMTPWSSPDTSWQTVGFSPAGDYLLDGRTVAHSDRGALVDSFEKGECVFSVGEEQLSVVHLGQGVMLEFPPGTEFKIPRRQEGESGLLEIELIAGGLRVSTADEFRGRLQVRTPDSTILLSGYSLGIDVVARGTCICIVDGEAEVIPFLGDKKPLHVAGNSTTFIERQGGGQLEEAGVTHRDELEAFSVRSDKYLF